MSVVNMLPSGGGKIKGLTPVSMKYYGTTGSSYQNRTATISQAKDAQYKAFLLVVSAVGLSGQVWYGLQNFSVPANATLLGTGTDSSNGEEYIYMIPAQGASWTYTYQSRGYIADYVWGITY